MKGLDTPALLEILEGTPAARQELKRLRGEELSTTEGNLLELTLLASRGGSRSRSSRLEAVERLRRRLTILPLDGRATGAASLQIRKAQGGPAPLLYAILGAFEAAGCAELLTADPGSIPGKWGFRVRRFASSSR